ncbi:MAG: EAL domain-containing protein [Aeromicrobium erythreum]
MTTAASTLGAADAVVPAWPAPARTSTVSIAYAPILDVARGQCAGYHVAPVGPGGDPVERAVATVEAAWWGFSTLPVNTFVSVALPGTTALEPPVLEALAGRDDLSGIVIDLAEPESGAEEDVAAALAPARTAGALLAIGGAGGAQPSLRSITRLRPSIIRLGQAWVDQVDRVEAKRQAIALTGSLASQLDAWILAESVQTPGQLRALSELGVPLAQGPLVGPARQMWSPVSVDATAALPRRSESPVAGNAPGDPTPGAATDPIAGADTTTDTDTLRGLVRQAYATQDAGAAREVLPGTTGFDVVVVVDEASRPVSLLASTTTGWRTSDAWTVNVDTSVAEAAGRAMTREAGRRFDPVVCTDPAGRLVGLVRVEQLVQHLARR